MNRWTWGALAVVVVAGCVTGWYSYQLQMHHMTGLPPREPEPRLLALSALPSVLFLVAGLLLRRSDRTLRAMIFTTVFVAAFRVTVIRRELAREWTHGTGFVSSMAWLVGVVVAGAFVVFALGMYLGSRADARSRTDRPFHPPTPPEHVQP